MSYIVVTTTAPAAVLRGVDVPFTFEDVVLEDIRPDELLVRIVATGLCHTDLAVQHGHIPGQFPLLLGHEGSGTVEQVGSAVGGFAVGDNVALSFASCGHCDNFLLLNVAGVREDGSVTMADADGRP